MNTYFDFINGCFSDMTFDQMVKTLDNDVIDEMRDWLEREFGRCYDYTYTENELRTVIVEDYTKEIAKQAIDEILMPWKMVLEVASYAI